MPTPITIDANVNLNFRTATAQATAFQKQFQSGFNKAGGLKGITTDVNSFDNALGRATSRIVSLGAASVVFNSLRKSFGAFADATVEVEQALAKINVNLGQSADGLKQFGSQIFNVARQTGSTFEEAAKGAEELARQGLGAEETLKRLSNVLILSRVSGLSLGDSIDAVTASINTFNKEALDSTDVMNKFVAVSTKFAVSGKDLAEGVSRAGVSASEAGVGFNQLLAVITSVAQTTKLSGSNISNSLNTIFTRVGRPEVLDQLQAIGVAVKDTEGNTLPAIRVLQNLATTYDGLSAAQKNVVSREIAGASQTNVLKAALVDLNKEQSTYNSVLKATANIQDAGLKKNEELNKTLASLINSTKVSITQLLSSLGEQDLAPFTKALLGTFEKVRSFLSGGDTGDGIGKSLGEGILKGLANVLSGPGLLGLAVVLGKGFGKIIATIGDEVKGLLSINDASSKRAEIQQRIVSLLKLATAEEYAQVQAASSVLAQKEKILAISARIRQTELIGTPLQNAFLGEGLLGGPKITGPKKVGAFAKGIPHFADPLYDAIRREKAAGVPEHQIYVGKDQRLVSPDNPQGLGIANKRDEPAGLHQGVDRILSQGGDPKKAGHRPNFAAAPSSRAEQTQAQQEIRSLFGQLEKVKTLGPEFEKLGSQIFDASKKLSKVAQDNALGKLADQSTRLVYASKIVSDQSRKGGAYSPIAPGYAKAMREQDAYFSSPRIPSETGDFLGSRRRRNQGPSIAEQRETFLGEQINSRRSFAFNRATTKFSQGGTITPAQLRLIEEELREQASQKAKSQFAPGTSRTVLDAFANSQSQIGLRRLRSQNAISSTEAGSANEAAVAEDAFQRSQSRRRNVLLKGRERQSIVRNRVGNATLAAAFVLPAAAGFIPEGQGGTNRGIGFGAASGALTGAGTGAVLGPVGAGIGAVIGGLAGAFLKLRKSTEEVAADFDHQSEVRNNENNAISRTIQLQEQLNDALKDGADSSTIDRITKQLSQARSGVNSSEGRRVINATDNKARDAAQQAKQDEDARKDAANRARLLLYNGSFKDLSSPTSDKASGNEEFARALKGALTDDQAKQVSNEQLVALQKIAAGNFNVKPIGGGGDEFGVRSPIINQSAIDKAASDLKAATELIAPLAKGSGLKPEDINKESVNGIALALVRAIAGKRNDISETDVDKKRREEASNRLPLTALTRAPNLDIVSKAAAIGRSPTSSNGARSQSRFDLLNELSDLGVVNKGVIQETSGYKQAAVGVQAQNVGEIGIAHLQQNNPGIGNLRDTRGDPELESIRRLLESEAQAGGRNAGDASIIAKAITQVQNNQKDVKTDRRVTPYNFSASESGTTYGIATTSTSGGKGAFITKDNVGSAIGARSRNGRYITKDTIASEVAKNGTRTYDLVKQAQTKGDKAATAAAEETKQPKGQLDIQGTINLIADGVPPALAALIKTAVVEGTQSATAKYFKSVQPQIDVLTSQVAVLIGKPLPPRPANAAPVTVAATP